MSVTGHKSEQSLKTYTGFTDDKMKQRIAGILSSKTNIDSAELHGGNAFTEQASSSVVTVNHGDITDLEIGLFDMGIENLAIDDLGIENLGTDDLGMDNQGIDDLLASIEMPVVHKNEKAFHCMPIIQNCNVTINYWQLP